MDDRRLASNLMRSAFFPKATHVSRLLVLVKSHKPQGEVVCRPVHASPNYVFSSLSHWLIPVLRAKLNVRAPHLLKDSGDLVSRLSRIKPTGRWHMAKVDVKDFYMCGTREEICSEVLSLWEDWDPMKRIVAKVVEFLLEAQYIADPWDEPHDTVHGVGTGTGMGLPHSGDLADVTLLALMEIKLLKREILNHHGIE
eukprot:7161943-Pyramimonas_sp.AAC.1